MTVKELTDQAHEAYEKYVSRFEFGKNNPHFRVVCDTADRRAWLKARSQYIGASDAASILGENPWSSPMDVYASKLGIDEDESQSEPAYWGLALEPILLEEFQRRTSRHTEAWGELLVSKERPWQSCTMDGVQVIPATVSRLGDRGGVEVKCTRLSWNWDEGIPPYVQAQIQHQYAVTGFDVISVVVLFNGNAFFQKDVPRDEEYIEFLNAKELEFWNRLQAFEPPDPDESDSCKQALARLYPRDNGETVVFPPEFNELDSRLVALKDEHKEIGGAIRGLENKFRTELGAATKGICSDGTIYTCKSQTRKAHDVEESTFRVLRRKGGKL